MPAMNENRTDETTPADPAYPAQSRKRRTHPLLLLLLAVVPVAIIGWVLYQAQVKKLADENRQLNNQLVYNMVGPSRRDDRAEAGGAVHGCGWGSRRRSTEGCERAG
jgi:uncharacterized protein HemX